MFSADLISRLQRRAADPRIRSDASYVTGGTSFGGGALRTTVIGLDGRRTDPPPLPPPASADDIAGAEARLGRSLPDDLKQLYRHVADGGFGPSGGLAPLKDIVERYLDLVADPPGEGGQSWPEHLLPINLSEPGADCYDLLSGQIVFWDEESLDGPSDRTWERSFEQEAESLSAWLEDWLSKPVAADVARKSAEEAALIHLRATIPILRQKTPEEREALGITGGDWEEALCRQFGVDPADL
jgi:hypothetical protein